MEGQVLVKILFFGKSRDLVKASVQEVHIRSVSATHELAQALEETFPELVCLRGCFALALNEEYLAPGEKFNLVAGLSWSSY